MTGWGWTIIILIIPPVWILYSIEPQNLPVIVGFFDNPLIYAKKLTYQWCLVQDHK